MRPYLLFIAVLITIIASACVKRPVLYPNERFQTIGREMAEYHVDQCIEKAKKAGLKDESKGGEVANRSAIGALSGAAVGAAVGAVTGNVGREAGIGAAAGGTSGLISGIFSAKEPDPVHKRYVEECLKEQGFEPAAWK